MDGVVKSNAFLDRVSLSPGTGQLDQYFSLLQKNGSALGRRINLRLRRQRNARKKLEQGRLRVFTQKRVNIFIRKK